MNERDARSIRKPRTDERQLWDLLESILGAHAVLVAHDLKLFSLLSRQPLSTEAVAQALNIARRPAAALLTVCVAAGLLQRHNELYSLTALAEDYLLDTSPTYFGAFLDAAIADPSAASYRNVKKAVMTNSSPLSGGDDWAGRLQKQPEFARGFIRAMHGHSMGPALAWPEVLDLSQPQRLLDIAGGSGAHAIGAAIRWPELRAVVFDLPAVCEVAEEFIANYGLRDRISSHAGDMWTDPFPGADLHFYSDIFHDWAPDKCSFLARKSFDSLARGGRIVVHEMLYNDAKTGPFTVSAYNIALLMMTEGQQFSGPELTAILTAAGFADVEAKPTFGYWSIVVGRKP